MKRDTCVCVFLKPPVTGKVKTRLIPTVGAAGAAALAEAFFRDTWNCVQSLPWAVPILTSTDSVDRKILPHPETQVWLQGGGDLGARIERVLRRALTQAPFAMALGADSPGIPPRLLDRAHDVLQHADAVLGPCDDGGFYLLGVRECNLDLLADIPWSQATTFARTLDRLHERGLKVTVLDPWYDVDRPEDLDRLRGELARRAIAAPYTTKVLADLPAAAVPDSDVSVHAMGLDSKGAGTQVR